MLKTELRFGKGVKVTSLKDFKFRLQQFSEGDGDDGTDGDKGGDKGGGRTFTQEDLNNIVAKAVKSEQEKMLKDFGFTDFTTAKEGVEKYKEWQKTQMSDLELTKKEKEELASKMAEYESKLKQSELTAKLAKAKIKDDSIEDVLKLLGNSEDFDKDLKAILEKYPNFLEGEDKSKMNVGGKGSKTDIDIDKQNELRRAMNLKPISVK